MSQTFPPGANTVARVIALTAFIAPVVAVAVASGGAPFAAPVLPSAAKAFVSATARDFTANAGAGVFASLPEYNPNPFGDQDKPAQPTLPPARPPLAPDELEAAFPPDVSVWAECFARFGHVASGEVRRRAHDEGQP